MLSFSFMSSTIISIDVISQKLVRSNHFFQNMRGIASKQWKEKFFIERKKIAIITPSQSYKRQGNVFRRMFFAFAFQIVAIFQHILVRLQLIIVSQFVFIT